ncbi:LysR family transcriptional regulator, glycine cleavage system transcriptional activator [Monaibacterium marinum]|uniref:LysR family transcriptional regulator, glycine cleavage system transcriptional activator n=1 Tax=Pontivivens marinum TaxID=1690039 RepID=A0A2C9CS10_9RHOB|nr:LysR substrate-binding domain-containing protein [Monaibacterium marinum]SOH94331.1 LysR family transcriptional regulator, glycine cleavage system transcriptional activator [Monaibacterium marinum]
MRQLPHVTWLRSFEAAARHSSFSSAADELNLTPAAVSQQIRLLEHHLGVQLFKRLAKGVELTDIGQAYALPIRKSFLEMQSATDGLFSTKRKSPIRIRASISFAALILAPRLNAFRRQHPEVEIELSTTVWSDRMSDATIDLDIRFGTGDWPEHNIHLLQIEPSTIICHPDYAAQFADKPPAQAIRDASIVQIVGSETDWDLATAQYDPNQPRPKHWMKADSSLVALQIIGSGHGCTIVTRSFAKHELADGRLVAPLPLQLPAIKNFFLVERDDLGQRDDVRAFIDWICAETL